MKKVLLLLLVIALLIPGCGKQPSAQPLPANNYVEISLTFNHRSGIASNQFAVWIEDSGGNYIKTLYVTRFVADGGWKTRADAVPGWVVKSGISAGTSTATDVNSGATPKSGLLTYVWDCMDAAGKPVPPGDYRFVTEGTIFWKDAVTFSGVIKVGGEENTGTAEAQFTTEEARQSDMITDVKAVYKP